MKFAVKPFAPTPFLCAVALAMLPYSWMADASPTPQSQPLVQLAVNPGNQPAIALESSQAKLGDILKQFAEKTGVVIHYSVLPEEPVTATCAGDSVKQVMECLLGNKVDRVYRKVNNTQTNSKLTKASIAKEEIWILGTRYGGSNMSCTLEGDKSATDKKQPFADPQIPQNALIRIAQNNGIENNPEMRKQAISMLAASGKTGNPETDAELAETFQDALKDKDPDIRAQAVYGLLQQDSNNIEVLNEAMRDENIDVRLMAVDRAPNNTPEGQDILKQALQDRDKTIQALAQQKLAGATIGE